MPSEALLPINLAQRSKYGQVTLVENKKIFGGLLDKIDKIGDKINSNKPISVLTYMSSKSKIKVMISYRLARLSNGSLILKHT